MNPPPCSFCGDDHLTARKLIGNEAGTAVICDECILDCMMRLSEDTDLPADIRKSWKERVQNFALNT